MDGTGVMGALGSLLRLVFLTPRLRGLFLASAAGIALLYGVFLPEVETQRLALSNLRLLTPLWAAFSAGFGVVLGWILTVQAWAAAQVAHPASGGGWLAVAGSALPNLLCCTPLLPTALAFLGVPATSLWHISGPIQGFLAVHDDWILSFSLALGVASALWVSGRAVLRPCAVGRGSGR